MVALFFVWGLMVEMMKEACWWCQCRCFGVEVDVT
jgi:hypothetical protein